MVKTEKFTYVSIPITGGGLVQIRDLRDLLEAIDDQPEDYYVQVLPGELRYEDTQ